MIKLSNLLNERLLFSLKNAKSNRKKKGEEEEEQEEEEKIDEREE